MTTSSPLLENDPYFDYDNSSGSSNDRDIFLVLGEEEKKHYCGPAFCVGCTTCCLTHSCAAGCLAGLLAAPLLRCCCTHKQEVIRARLIGGNTSTTRPSRDTTSSTTQPAEPIEATAVEPLVYADYYESSSSPPVMATATFVDCVAGAEKIPSSADNADVVHPSAPVEDDMPPSHAPPR
jgi:hypothetical protein